MGPPATLKLRAVRELIFCLDTIMHAWIVVLVIVVLVISGCAWFFVSGGATGKKLAMTKSILTEAPEYVVRDPRTLYDPDALIQNSDIPSYLMTDSIQTREN
jgi:hypothetical protein